MSLSYSVWQSESSGGTTAPSRKRVPSIGMRKTIKTRPQYEDTIAYSSYDSSDISASDSSSSHNVEPAETFEVAQKKQTDMSERVHKLLDGITGFSDGGELGDFNPMPYPTQLIHKHNPPQNKISADNPIPSPASNPLMPKTRAVLPKLANNASSTDKYFQPSNGDMTYTNYRDAYNRESMVSGLLGEADANKKNGPYYQNSLGGDKLTEKLNYLIHMMEGMQMEKTSNITEEFILYCLLGTFMIYIVDGFSRGGKYIR